MNHRLLSKFRLLLPLALLLIVVDGRAQVLNGKVAFLRDGDIYTTLGGETGINLTNNAANNRNPVFSPDGTKIVFTSSRNGGGTEVFTMNADGSNVVQLTTTTSFESSPSFSPDGTKIVFARQSAVNAIFVMNADGSNQIGLTSGFIAVDNPQFSPDGSKIIFTGRGSSGNSILYTMSADGSNLTPLPGQPSDGNNTYPSYSPDGARLLFRYQNPGSFLSKIFLSSADGSNMTAIVQASPVTSPVNSPTFSPDGTKILYTEQYSFNPVVRLRIDEYTIADGTSRVFTDNATNPAWQPVRPAAVRRTNFDFDGDGKSDVAVFRPSEGIWYLSNSSGGFSARQFGISTDKLVPADFDGDGKTDIAVFRRGENSTWYILQSSNNAFRATRWGASNEEQAIIFDTPVPADYDGDGKADLSVFRRTDNLSEPARFLILQSSDKSTRTEQWGAAFDTPVPADYDGDGKTDVAVVRGNVWYISQTAQGFRAVTFGATDDKFVPADYDGDGKIDIAVFRPSTGVWYLLLSSANMAAVTFGTNTDIPVPADYDGDGKADVAVFRNGIWYLNRSTQGFTGITFGAATDKPVPNAFVP